MVNVTCIQEVGLYSLVQKHGNAGSRHSNNLFTLSNSPLSNPRNCCIKHTDRANMASSNPKPIVFPVADMSIQVFSQAFHVNSDILKVHSEFFRKFLDSPDKGKSPTSKAGNFKYEWVTQVDADRIGWNLTSKDKASVCLDGTDVGHFLITQPEIG